MKPARFDYLRAATLAEAHDALAEEDASVIAGGQSLVPLLSMRMARPKLLVDIMHIGGLGGIALQDGVIRVGPSQQREHVLDSRQRASAALHCRNGVVEARRRRIGGDPRERRALLGHGVLECGMEMFRRDVPEWRHCERVGPGGEERVLGHGYGRVALVRRGGSLLSRSARTAQAAFVT